MDDDQGPQFALQIALQTLKERCQVLQHRLSVVEKENVLLRERCNKTTSKDTSPTEADALRGRIARLTDQKAKLKYNVSVVVNENKQLWLRLSNLTQANKSMGSQLTKINDSLNQHNKKSSPLIRSNTYTQSDGHPKVSDRSADDSDVSLDLEDISLVLISNILKEKTELETQCSEMAEIQRANSFGFSYLSDDISDSLIEEFDKHVSDLKLIKESLLVQNEALQKTAENQGVAKCNKCLESENRLPENRNRLDADEELQLESLARWGTPENSNTFLHNNTVLSQEMEANICPICNLTFCRDNDQLFFEHVETHFRELPAN